MASDEERGEILTPSEQLGWCLDNLGERITAVGVGKADARPLRQWRDAGLPDEYVSPVEVLYGAGRQITDVYDASTARSFLRSANRFLGNQAVIELTPLAGVDPTVAQNVSIAVDIHLEK